MDIVACLASTGALRGFGAARLVPRRDYALSELKLNGIEAERLLSPTESTISNLRDAVSKNVAVIVILTVFAAPLLAWNDSDTIPAAYHDSITAVANVTVGDERFTDSGEFFFTSVCTIRLTACFVAYSRERVL